MNWTLRFEGGNELATRLEMLPENLSRKIMVEALQAGAQPIQARAAQGAPRRTGRLATHIGIGLARRIGSPQGGRWRQSDETEFAVAVGPTKDVFYGLFQEYGTRHHGAQPFMRPAFDTQSAAALGIIADRLWEALRRAVPGSFGSPSPTTIGSREL